jgi:hypothetical protein
VNVTTTQPATRTDLERQLRREGSTPGLPVHITEATVRTDKSICRRMLCPGCERRGLEYRPWQQGRRYRVVATCPACNCTEEL